MDSSLRKLGEKLLFLDLFGEEIGFNIRGKASKKSIPGFVISIAIFSLVCAFGIKRLKVMNNYGDTIHQITLNEG